MHPDGEPERLRRLGWPPGAELAETELRPARRVAGVAEVHRCIPSHGTNLTFPCRARWRRASRLAVRQDLPVGLERRLPCKAAVVGLIELYPQQLVRGDRDRRAVGGL